MSRRNQKARGPRRRNSACSGRKLARPTSQSTPRVGPSLTRSRRRSRHRRLMGCRSRHRRANHRSCRCRCCHCRCAAQIRRPLCAHRAPRGRSRQRAADHNRRAGGCLTGCRLMNDCPTGCHRTGCRRRAGSCSPAESRRCSRCRRPDSHGRRSKADRYWKTGHCPKTGYRPKAGCRRRCRDRTSGRCAGRSHRRGQPGCCAEPSDRCDQPAGYCAEPPGRCWTREIRNRCCRPG